MSKYLNWAAGKNGALGKVSGLSTEYFVGAAGEHGVMVGLASCDAVGFAGKTIHQDFFWCNMA